MNDILKKGRMLLKGGTALGTGIILGEIATKFIPGGAWIPVKGIAYMASVVLADMISVETDCFIDKRMDEFEAELGEEG